MTITRCAVCKGVGYPPTPGACHNQACPYGPKPGDTAQDAENKAGQILQAYYDGTLQWCEAEEQLDALEIRGGFSKRGFTGYDYRHQRWLEFALWAGEVESVRPL